MTMNSTLQSPKDPLGSQTAQMFDLAANYVKNFKRFQLAEKTKLLIDGAQTFPAMLEAIGNAQKTIDLETYILAADKTGHDFQRALLQANSKGVKVRLLYDAVGALGLPDGYVTKLLDAGVSVRVYHPLILLRPDWAINKRDHRKILIVDEKITFTGGINICDLDASKADGGAGWRDTHIQINGKMVAGWAKQLFEYAWRKATDYPETATPKSKLKAGIRKKLKKRFKKPITLHSLSHEGFDITNKQHQKNRIAVQLISNREIHKRKPIRSAYLRAINQAKKYILIENAYFIPDRHIRNGLIRAVSRGVKVCVIVAKNTDVKIAGYASKAFYDELLTAGVQIYQWPMSMMHAKTAVIDDIWSVVGSFNLDHRSLRSQLEIVALIADPSFAKELRNQTEIDIASCEELTLEKHRSRPQYSKIFERIAYYLRYWL